jgi:hypothetical protein
MFTTRTIREGFLFILVDSYVEPEDYFLNTT